MLSPDAATWRLAIHVLAASVWVGGQFALAGLVPALRRIGPDAPKAAAHAFARIAWPAFAVLVATGVWNLVEVDVADTSTSYQVTVIVKVLLATVSGIAAAAHQASRSRLVLALGGAIGAVAALGALFVGVLLGTGG